MYLTGSSGPEVRAYALAHPGELGLLNTPNSNYQLHDWPAWAADNGAFRADTYVGDERWFAWLESKAEHAGRCWFATAPDVVGDAAATLERSLPWLPRIRALGYPAALVAQDGLEELEVPWDAFDVLFIGGTDAYKLGPAAAATAAEAKRRGKGVHVGRVNSHKRLRYAAYIGADTADGTFLAFGPGTNLPRMEVWLGRLRSEPTLFDGAAAW